MQRLPRGPQLFLPVALFTIWLAVVLLFSAVPGDLFYFPKLVLVNPRLSSFQKLDSLWVGYARAQQIGDCKRSILIEQELLKETRNAVLDNRVNYLAAVQGWQVPAKLNCPTAMPFKELKLLARVSSNANNEYVFADIVKVQNLRVKVSSVIELSRHTGFRSQSALNAFAGLALDLQNRITLALSGDPFEIYEFELKLATMQNILDTGDTIAQNYQQLFLASCLLSPEYEVCQSADKFNAKWNSVASAGNVLRQLELGRELLNEVLVYQGLLTND